MPASNWALRATLAPCSPAWKPQPIMMSTVWAKSTSGLRSTSAFSGTAARSSARTSLRDPLTARPIGVRTASTMTASGMLAPRLTDQSTVPRSRAEDADGAGGQRAAVGELLRRLGPAGARGEQPGGERVAGAGGVDQVGRLGRGAQHPLAVGPQRPAGAEGHDHLAAAPREGAGGPLRFGLAGQHARLVGVGEQQASAGDPLEER